ncbi:MAG: fused MFS/spermidine synthase [Acidobacteriota bacterium]
MSRLVLLLTLFFGSGACALVYQVLWLRLLSLVFGVTVYAASTVLAAFMAGLALGSLAATRAARRLPPLVAFGLAEILIGVSALATPLGLDAATLAYDALHRAAPDSLGLLTVARLVCSMVVLLVPTTLMGMTLPLLSASALVRGSSFGARVGALYAVNTAGAVVGAVTTGFVFIGALGMSRTFVLAAVVNLAIGALALLLARDVAEAEPAVTPAPTPATPSSAAYRAVWFVVGLSGFASLALEIVWFRVLLQFLPATTYAFTTMLGTVLAGIAAGGGLGARLLRRDRDWLQRLAWLQLGTGLAALVSLIFLGWSYAAGWRTSGDIQACVAAIFPAACLMGVAFPVALRIAADDAGRTAEPAVVSRRVGRLYAVNVAGAIAGSLAGGFLALPLLGSRAALIAMAGLYLAGAALLVGVHAARNRLLVPLAAGALLFVYAASEVPDPFRVAHARRYGSEQQEIWRQEGVQTAVSVHASLFRRTLYLDGLHQANDTPDMVRLHRIIGHLPMVLHPNPRRALVIGLGGGATPGAVSRHPGVDVQVVELSESVRQAAALFSHVNYGLLAAPHVRIRIDDGRNFLRYATGRYDVVTADIIQPIHAGAGNLYSVEYFELVRHALADGGLVLQWIGHRPESQYKLIMRTFIEVFPHATLWFDGQLMVGALAPLRVAHGLVEGKRADATLRQALNEVGLTGPEVLRSWYTAGPDEMRRFVGSGPLLTDDRPLVEYHRSLPAGDPPVDVTGVRGDPDEVFDPS